MGLVSPIAGASVQCPLVLERGTHAAHAARCYKLIIIELWSRSLTALMPGLAITA